MTDQTNLTTIPLALCRLSPMNPRQIVDADDITDLAASIRGIGLIQSLAGWRNAAGEIEIVAGGRRLRALQQIASEDGADPETIAVPVILAATEAEAQNWAATENIARLALHPADEIAAYRDMGAAGSSAEDIAKAFAVTVRHVKGRLRLAGLADPVLAALRANEITLETAAAYCLAADPEQQIALFEDLKGSYYADNPREVRHRLTSEMANPGDKLARLVGRAAYAASGGDVREDLFGEDVYYADPDILTRLALDRLEAERTAYLESGWKWAEAGIERPSYEDLSSFARTYPEPVEISDEDAARYDALADAIAAGEATEEEDAAFADLSERLDRVNFTAEQKARAGVILSVGYDGEINAVCGVVRPEDRAAAEEAGVCQPSQHGQRQAQGADAKQRPYSAALMADLATLRTVALQTALIDKPELALDLLTFVLATPIYSGANPLGIATNAPKNEIAGDDGLTLAKALRQSDEEMPLTGAQAVEAFTRFRRKKPATKKRMLTDRIARLVSVGLSGEDANPFADLLVDLAGTDVRAVWHPSAAFLNRLKSDQLDRVLADIRGDVPTGFAKLRKRDKVERLSAIFADEPGAMPLSCEQKARAAAWLPEGLAPVGKVEDQIAAE